VNRHEMTLGHWLSYNLSVSECVRIGAVRPVDSCCLFLDAEAEIVGYSNEMHKKPITAKSGDKIYKWI
jgi:hypothetical protein